MAIVGGLRAKFALDITSFMAGLEKAKKEYDRRAQRAIKKGALLFVREVKIELSKTGTGKHYRRGRKVHIASAPGQPPAVDTGQLRASITHLVEREFRAWIGRVGTNLEKAAPLEFGTSRMAARPFMLTTLTRIRPQLIRLFERELSG